MRRKLSNVLLVMAVISLGFFACKKDKGNYDYTELPEFKVDTAGIGNVMEVTQFNALVIQPKINFKGEESNLSYIWRIFRREGKTIIDTLATEKNLNKTIPNQPGKYFVELQVRQSPSGITEVVSYKVDVIEKNALPRGLMVFEEHTDRIDLSLITSPVFLSGASVQENILKDIFFANNGERLTGKPVQVQMIGRSVYLLTSNDMREVDATRFTVTRNFDGLFFNTPPVYKQPKFVGSDGKSLVNDKDVYIGNGASFSAPVFAVDGKPYEAAPYIMPTRYSFMIYDQLNTRYLLAPELSNKLSIYTMVGNKALFNPASTGKQMVLQGMGFPVNNVGTAYKSSWGIFKNPVDNNVRELMIINEPNGPQARIDISSAPEILQATTFAAGELNAFCIYGANNKLYRIQADLVSGTVSTNSAAGFTAPSDEIITAIDILRTTNKMIFVATWSPTKAAGKLYLLSLNEVNGSISSVLKEWTGFGKIISINLKNI